MDRRATELQPKGPARKVLLGLLVLAVIAAGVSGYWFFFMRGIVYSDDARFAGHLVDLAPELSGTLEDVLVHEGERVKQGQLIFKLDARVLGTTLTEKEAAVETAKGKVAAAQAQYERAVNGPRPEEIKAGIAAADKLGVDENQALVELNRVRALKDRGVSAADELDRATAAYESAKQAHEEAVQNLAVLQVGTRSEDIESAKATLEAAKGGLGEAQAVAARAKLDVDRCSVASPFDGWVVRRWLDPGAAVQAGVPVVTVFDPSTLRVDANIEERYLHSVAVGDSVDISVDAFPGLRLTGHVKEILRATNSEFSLIPSEGVSGTYIKVTQRVPLRISVEAPDDLVIGPGLSVEVRIHVRSPKTDSTGALAHE